MRVGAYVDVYLWLRVDHSPSSSAHAMAYAMLCYAYAYAMPSLATRATRLTRTRS